MHPFDLLSRDTPRSITLVDHGYRMISRAASADRAVDLLRRAEEALDQRKHPELIREMRFEISWSSKREIMVARIEGGRAERIREQHAAFAGMVRRLADPTPLP